jgi:hypothetical protein
MVGQHEQVVALADNFSYGPVNPADASSRMRWVYDFGDYDDADIDQDVNEIEDFWRQALSPCHRLVAWVSRRSTADYAGFLEWLWRLGDGEAYVVDVTELHIMSRRDGRRQRVTGTGEITAAEMVGQGLLDAGRPIAAAQRVRDRARWSALRTENAPLRVFVNGELSSAPLSFYDDRLLAAAAPEWQEAAKLLVNVMGAPSVDAERNEVSDLVLWVRLRALVAGGQLASRGDLLAPRSTEVRLPALSLGG